MSPESPTTAAPGSATRLAVDVRRLSWIRPLVADYADQFSRIRSRYAGDPRSTEDWRETCERVAAHPRPRQEMAACVAAQQARRSAPPEARAAAAKLADPRTVTVVTGQQAGAFGGPLYTLLKAINAIQLARRAEATLGRPVVPVFWVDAEDHDWDEVAGSTLLDRNGQPRTLTIAPPDGAGELPVGQLRLDDRIVEALDALEATLIRTDFTVPMTQGLRLAYQPGAGMADAFARFLDSILGPHGLVVFDPSDPAAKPLAAGVFARELAEPGRTAALAIHAGRELDALGHAPQVVPQPDAVAVFRMEGRRTPIRRQDGRLVAGDTTFDPEDLAREAASEPHRFSPNVLLRPIVQDTLLPTVCYVAGPSELAYLGQLREVYAWFGVPMPLIYPRASATLVDAATARFVSRYDVRLEDLQPQDEAALNRLLEAQLPQTVEASLADAEASVRTAMERVIEVIPAVDPTLAGAARSTLGKIEHEIKTLHGKMIQAAKRRDETLRRQFIRAQVQTFPLGQPQERTLGLPYFLNQYGPALIDRLIEELPLDLGQHWVMAI